VTGRGACSTIRLPPSTELRSVTAWAAAGPPHPTEIDWSASTPVGPAPSLLAAYAQSLTRLLFAGSGYSAAGLPDLRAAIAERYTNGGLRTRPDQICVTAGAQQALSMLVALTVRRRDRVLVESPTYPGVLDLLHSHRAGLTCVPVDRDWSSAPLHAGLTDPGVRLAYLMPVLHNPTGLTMADDQQDALSRTLSRPGCKVILDETLADLTDPAGTPTPLAAIDAIRVVRVGSLSKTVWGGLRIGWTRSDVATVQALVREKTRTDLGAPLLEQLVAVQLLADYPALLSQRRLALRDARTRAVSKLSARLPCLELAQPQLGPTLWCRLPHDLSSAAVVDAARRRGLRLVDGTRFSPNGLLAPHLRLPVDVHELDARGALDRLALAIEDSAKR